jgi:D-glycero-D-manno-heptose 1,7-bisphosphate phosphatase
VGQNTEKSERILLKPTKPAIFMDADGTLWPDYGPGSIFYEINLEVLSHELLSLSQAFSTKHLFVVSNQTCVARGLKTLSQLEERVDEIENYVRKLGLNFSFEYCLHHPEASDEKYRVSCACRKPAPGLIQDISNTWSIDLKKSLFIGDRITDAQAASYAGINRIFLIDNDKLFEQNVSHIKTKESYIPIAFIVISSISSLLKYTKSHGLGSFWTQ